MAAGDPSRFAIRFNHQPPQIVPNSEAIHIRAGSGNDFARIQGDLSVVIEFASQLRSIQRRTFAMALRNRRRTSDSIGDIRAYGWINPEHVTGISWERGSARLTDVVDGTSHTYLVGEKRISRIGYGTSADNGYDQSMFSGVDLDTTRWTHLAPAQDSLEMDPLERRFGSVHSSGFHMAMCDSSIQFLSYSIDGQIHRERGTRN